METGARAPHNSDCHQCANFNSKKGNGLSEISSYTTGLLIDSFDVDFLQFLGAAIEKRENNDARK